MKFRTKLTLLFLIVTLSITGLVIHYVYIETTKSLEAQIKDELKFRAIDVMDKIDRMLYERYSDIRVIVTDTIISSRDSTPKQITERLIECRDINKTYVSLSFFDLNRIRIADTAGLNIGQQHSMTKDWEEIYSQGFSRASSIRESESLKVASIYFSSIVNDDNGEAFGVVVARVPIVKLHDIVAGGDPYKRPMVEIDLLNKDGLLIYSNYNRKGILTESLADYEAVKRSISGEKVGSFIGYESFFKETDIFAFAREQGYLDFKGNGWTLLLHLPIKVAFVPAAILRNQLVYISSIIVLLSVIISVVFARTISRPLLKLKETARKIGEGDWDIKIDVKSKDEIGELGMMFNEMVRNLRATTTSIDLLHKEIEARKHVEDNLSQEKYKLVKTQQATTSMMESLVLSKKSLEDKTAELEKSRKSIMNMMEDVKDEHAQAEAMQKIAEEASKAKGEFLANMSHELRTPLNAIIGFVDLLGDTSVNEKQKEYLRVIRSSGDMLLMLISDILDISKIESAQVTWDSRTFELNELCKTALEIAKIKAEGKDIKIYHEISGDVPKNLVGDVTRIRQILINLIGNAIKFTKQGEIKLKVILDESDQGSKSDSENLRTLKISVKDTGIGIPKDKQSQIFEIFMQVDSSVKKEHEGVGLGLAITKSLVEKMGGTIRVESEPGRGCEFIFTLVLKEAVLDKDTGLRRPDTESVRGIKILFVDDDIINRKLLKEMLKKLECDAAGVGSGEEALNALKNNKFDLVLMDVQMPGLDGCETTLHVRREISKDIPIIALTAIARQEDHERCIASGMNDFLTKPIHMEKLKDKLVQWRK